MLTILFLACSSGPADDNAADSLLDEYAVAVAAAHDLVDGYATDVDAAADYDGVSALQTTYNEEMEHILEDLEHVLEDIGGCAMADTGAMDLAHQDVEGMHGLLEDLVAAHADHGDAAECVTASEQHDLDMDVHIEALGGHHDSWLGDTSMMCEMHQDEDRDDHADPGDEH